MRTVTWKSVLEGAFVRPGLSVPTVAAALNAGLSFVLGRLRTAWEYYKWPELLHTERRLFRDEWSAGVYAAGAEMYRNGSYWRATEATTADDVPGEYGSKAVILAGVGLAFAYSADGGYIIYTAIGGTVSKWVELVRYRKVVAYQQPGKTNLGAVLGAWTQDPLTYPEAVPADYLLAGDGVVFAPGYEPDGVWICFRERAPEVAPVVFDEAATYVAGDAVYIAPAAWAVVAATTAGETPATAPAKFVEIPFPAWLSEAVKAGAYGDLLEGDGASEKAARWDDKFTDLLEEQVWQLTKLQGQTKSLR